MPDQGPEGDNAANTGSSIDCPAGERSMVEPHRIQERRMAAG